MSHARYANEFLEVLCNELGTIITNHPRTTAGKQFSRPLNHQVHISFGHRFPDIPVHNVAATSIENADEVVKCTADIEVWVSRPGEFHPQPLSEPDRNLSAHPASTDKPLTAGSPSASAQRVQDCSALSYAGMSGREYGVVQNHGTSVSPT
jgi:hypothetical protein